MIQVAVHEIELARGVEDPVEIPVFPAGGVSGAAEVGPAEDRDPMPPPNEFVRQGLHQLGGAASTRRGNARCKGRHLCDPQDLALRHRRLSLPTQRGAGAGPW
ncbi:MAG: hypothetical protein ACYTFI_25165 [Planctomycetota bacterium]